MKRVLEFNAGYGRLLNDHDEPSLQILCEQCDDVALQLTGIHPGADAANKLLTDAALPSATQVRGSCIGIFDFSSSLIGVLIIRQHQPNEHDWYIGLLMFKPDMRARGYGHKVVEAFQHYVWEQRGKRILLAVMWSNPRAMAFWKRLGYETARSLGPMQFGRLMQSGVELQQRLNTYQNWPTPTMPVMHDRSVFE